MTLDYVALVMLILVIIIMFYGIIAIHDIPYEISVRRNHPHQDAIHVAGWISLFTMHALWPFLWVWATLYREDRGWGMRSHEKETASGGDHTALNGRIAALEARLVELEPKLQPEAAG
ncbi:MAG: hypothetical protein ACI9DH_001171 [Halioglobus sp.]|jgi:hypothetical protein